MTAITSRLIGGWRNAWRWWSVQLHVVGTTLAGLLLLQPSMPAELQAMLPASVRAILIALWFVAGLAARLVQQKPKAQG